MGRSLWREWGSRSVQSMQRWLVQSTPPPHTTSPSPSPACFLPARLYPAYIGSFQHSMTTGTPPRNVMSYGNITAFYGWQCQDPWWGNGTNCVAGWSANLNCGSSYGYICKIPFTSYPCMPPPRWVGLGQAPLWHSSSHCCPAAPAAAPAPAPAPALPLLGGAAAASPGIAAGRSQRKPTLSRLAAARRRRRPPRLRPQTPLCRPYVSGQKPTT